MSSYECIDCSRTIDENEAAAICMICYKRTENRWVRAAAFEMPQRIAKLATWRLAVLIVLWQVLSHVGGLIEGVWHWKLVTYLGA